MIKNYIKIAYRSLKRNLAYSSINILGLAIGISFSCMLYVYVNSELSYDSYHTNSSQLYRQISVDHRVPDKVRYYGLGTPPLAMALKQDYPEVVDATRLFRQYGQVVFNLNGVNFQEREWFTVDSNFFDLFDYDFINGDENSALQEPNSIVLNESTAIRIFGHNNPIGEILDIGGYGSSKVTAIVRDAPDNSHLRFNLLLSHPNSDDWNNFLKDWQNFGAYSYILLDKNSNISELKGKMPEFRKKYFGPFAEAFDVDFQNIEDIYFGSKHVEAAIENTHGQIEYIYIFGTMGIFILVIACINYINLATSKAVFRAKEIGIRKVVGAYKKQLITQFLTESLIVALVALVIAIGILDLIVPYFNLIVEKSLDFNINTLSQYILPLLGITAVIALLSGSYPAFYLSQLRPVDTLKGEDVSGKKSSGLRKVLVIFQFVLTIALIVSTMVIGLQLNFIQKRDIGFDKEHLAVIDINNRNVRAQFQVMKNEFAQIPGVTSVGVSSRVPGEWKNIVETYVKTSNPDRTVVDSIRSYFMGFDEGMFETYNFKLVAGDYFGSNDQNDSTKILLNEAAVQEFDLDEPLGATIILPTSQGPLRAKVIGVFSNFNFQSLHQKVAPIIIGTWNNPIQSIDYFTLKYSGNVESIIARANEVHEKFDLHTPMELHFLDEQLELLYKAEQQAGMIFNMGAGLSIFVACLGLFGLASFTIEKRRKELGVRKILGASESNLFLLLSSSFTKQILIAFLLASPIAFYLMNSWLESFEYRIELSVWIFIGSGLIALAIALLTISYRSLKAVNKNPVDSLRYE